MKKTLSMARGLVVLDENLEHLEAEFRKRNIRVLAPKKGMSDEEIAEIYASGRIIVTNNSQDFRDLAVEFEFGIIATESYSPKNDSLVAAISRGLIKHKLWGKTGAFIAKIQRNGTMKVTDLIG